MQAGRFLLLAVAVAGLSFSQKGLASVDSAGQEAAGIVAGIRQETGARLVYNENTKRLEVRDDLGNLLEEIAAGSVSRTVDAAGQEYRLSFGKDESGRVSVLVRPGSAMTKPLVIEVFGIKTVLTQDASLLATLVEDSRVSFEASICGEIYLIRKSSQNEIIGNQRLKKEEVFVIDHP